MADKDYLREDERTMTDADFTYDQFVERLQQRLAEARRVLALYHENHTRHWGRCDCDACELAAAALDGASR